MKLCRWAIGFNLDTPGTVNSKLHICVRENIKIRRVLGGFAALLTLAVVNGFARTRVHENGVTQATSRGVVTAQHDSRSDAASQLAGHYFALTIGINNYQHLPKLKTAVSDAESVASILHDRYGFQTLVLRDATREQITHALNDYRRNLDENANLLIFYAGHGSYDKDADKAYWLPEDADPGDTTDWIMADDITTEVKVIPARHILIISDSCYSGGITREVTPAFTPTEQSRYLEKMVLGKSRTLMASGALEPVSDQGAAGHSVFADALLKGLTDTSESVFTAATLFDSYIRVSVAGRSEQTPQYNPIRNSGHDFGDFVFVRSGKAPASSAVVPPSHGAPSSKLKPPASTPGDTSRGGQPDSQMSVQPGVQTANSNSSVVGCWSWFNNSAAIFRSDGTVADGPFVAQWRLADPARQIYTITWPKAVDSVVLSADRMRVTGANQYGFPVSVSRVGGMNSGAGLRGSDPIVGTWRLANGQDVTLRGDGTLAAGTLVGQWKSINPMARAYNFIWPEPVDTLTLSADGLHLVGGNQYGVKTGGTKVAAVCPGAN